MKLTMPSLRRRRRVRLEAMDVKLDAIGAQLSVLCKLYAGEVEDEIPEPAAVPAHLYLVTSRS